MLEGLRTLIRSHPGMTVVGEAEDGQTAVELALELLPDIAIMDITMPGLNGIDAASRITSESGNAQHCRTNQICHTRRPNIDRLAE
jgi:YesN/AraC family two-component response regulator